MRVVKLAIWSMLLMPGIGRATVDPECLRHLGGAFADVECYNSLSNSIEIENKRLAREITVTIPTGSRNKGLLISYLQNQMKSRRYCELSRDSLAEWVTVKRVQNPRYFYYDVAYYQCVYDNLAHQNRFLKQLLENASRG